MPECKNYPIQNECQPNTQLLPVVTCPLLKLLEIDFIKKLENLIEDLH